MLIGGNLVLKSVVAKSVRSSCKPLSGLVCSHRLVYEDGCSLGEDGTKMVLKGQIAVSAKVEIKRKWSIQGIEIGPLFTDRALTHA